MPRSCPAGSRDENSSRAQPARRRTASCVSYAGRIGVVDRRGSMLLQAGDNFSDLNGTEGDTRRCLRRGFADVEAAGQLVRLLLGVEDGYRDGAAALRGEPVCRAGASLACHLGRVFLQTLSSFVY